MNIYLLRHGETAFNASGITQDRNFDIALSTNAIAELRHNVNAMLEQVHGSICIMTSPAKRAMQTASILCSASQQCKLITVKELVEVDFGSFGSKFDATPVQCIVDNMYTMLTMQDFRQLTIDYYHNGKTFTYPNGESCQCIHRRCKAIIAYILQYSKLFDNVIVVGHNRLFRHLLVELDIWSYLNMFDAKLPHAELFPIDADKVKAYSK